MKKQLRLISFVLAALSLPGMTACHKNDQAAADKAQNAAVKKATNSCIGALQKETPREVKIGDKYWTISGYLATEGTNDEDKKVIIGALSDIKEPSAANLKNLNILLDWFKQEQVDIIVVSGDSGDGATEIYNTLETIAKRGLPTATIIGNREKTKDYEAALAKLQGQYSNIFDLNKIRRIDGDDFDIISMPGYYDADYLHGGVDGCAYTNLDIELLDKLTNESNSPVVIISHGPPQMKGKNAIDAISIGDNRGDPQLTEAIKTNKIPFGIFGNIHEAGGKATNLEGNTVIAQGEMVSSLYLNPGPVDAVKWKMNDESVSYGMGAILTIDDGKASYKVYRIAADKAAGEQK